MHVDIEPQREEKRRLGERLDKLKADEDQMQKTVSDLEEQRQTGQREELEQLYVRHKFGVGCETCQSLLVALAVIAVPSSFSNRELKS